MGGWLALLVIGLLGLGPIMGAGRIITDFQSAERESSALASIPEWSSFKYATWSGFAAIAAISLYAGWGLANGRNRAVVRRATGALWVIGPCGDLVMLIIVPRLTLGALEGFDSAALTGPFVASFIRSTIVATIWTAYLAKSRRVRATYGAQP